MRTAQLIRDIIGDVIILHSPGGTHYIIVVWKGWSRTDRDGGKMGSFKEISSHYLVLHETYISVTVERNARCICQANKQAKQTRPIALLWCCSIFNRSFLASNFYQNPYLYFLTLFQLNLNPEAE